jgi:predicted RNA-binding protein with TRAM domain
VLYHSIYRGTISGGETYLTTVGDVLTYTDPGEPGKTYFYTVSAVNAIGEGARSNEASATVVSVPGAPRGMQALPNNQAVSLNWSAPSYPPFGALTYFLYRDGTEIWNGTSLNHWDAPLTKGQQHSYKVAAKSSMGMGPNCSEELAIPYGVPDAPWGFEVVPGNERMNLSWKGVNYTGPGTLVFHIFREGALIWSGPTISCLDTIVVNGMRYQYTVAASNDVGWSENSSALFSIPLGPPSAPMGLLAQPRAGSIQLNWSEPIYSGPGNTTYHLYRDGALIWSGEELGYVDNGLDAATSHSYTVAADNSIGKGPNCTAVGATPLSAGVGTLPIEAIAVVGFLSIAAIPIGFLAMQAYRHKQLLAVSIMSTMRCPNCGTILPVGTTRCKSCGVKIAWRKIEKDKPKS